jgi:hypothetical protein
MFVVNHNFKVSPSARCVCAANDTCKDFHNFKMDYITLNYIFITLLRIGFLAYYIAIKLCISLYIISFLLKFISSYNILFAYHIIFLYLFRG